MQIKVCGMNDVENLKAIAAFQPDYFGFIFYEKSPRLVTLNNLPKLENIKTTGVFVDAEIDFVLLNQKRLDLKAIQLHGNESKTYVSDLKAKLPSEVELLKALSIARAEDFEMTKTYEGLIDKFVLDTKTPLKGGSGKQFDWQLLEHYASETPFLLSGGIGPDDAETVKEVYNRHPNMEGVDINSKFELKPGLKSVEDIKTFITNLNT